MTAAAPLRCCLMDGGELQELVCALESAVAALPWPLSSLGTSGRQRLRRREPHRADSKIFPLPALSVKGGGDNDKHQAKLTGIRLANLWIVVLNWLYAGEEWDPASRVPTRAQQRLLDRISAGAAAFLRRSAVLTPGGEELRKALRMGGGGYGEAPRISVPLGERAGVPDEAAMVDTAAALKDFHEVAALQCEEPDELLVDVPRSLDDSVRPFAHLARTYPKLIEKAEAAGLVELVAGSELPQLDDKPVYGGAFAVPKDEKEDRMISPNEIVNSLVDENKLVKIQMPYLPQMRILTVPRRRKLLVAKRDARHYFHVLRAGAKWHRWLALPPVRRKDKLLFPLQRAWPMGFKGSAAFAQLVTEKAAKCAGLPARFRCLPSVAMTSVPPCWGAVIDDIWVLHTDGHDDDNLAARGWAPSVEAQWAELGVTAHPDKKVDSQPNVEVQGMMVDSVAHDLSLSPEKCLLLMCLLLQQATTWRPARRSTHRVVGKLGFAHGLRPCLRSILQDTHRSIHRAWTAGAPRLNMTATIAWELTASAILLPLCTMKLGEESAPWSNRVVASDASPGGHGLAYTRLDPGEVRDWASWASHRGDYTCLDEKFEHMAVPFDERTHLRKVKLPLEGRWWSTVPRPGGHRHITIEEYAAFVWSLEQRLHYADEIGCRCVQLADNGAQIGAHVKGRSSCLRLNRYCRKDAAVQLAGGFQVFTIYEQSKTNPADAPSSVFGVRAQRNCKPQGPYPLAELPRQPGTVQLAKLVFIHAFSGERRPEDLQWWLEVLGHAFGIEISCLSFDPANNSTYDIMDDAMFGALRFACWSGMVFGLHGGPVCATWSRLLWLSGGPPALRSRAFPFGLPHLQGPAREKCRRGTEFFLRHVDLMQGVICAGGAALLEHPDDPGGPPFASVFDTDVLKMLLVQYDGEKVVHDQCMSGCAVRKRTGLAGVVDGLSDLNVTCDRSHSHLRQPRRKDGIFTSKQFERYPSALCKKIAHLFIHTYLRRQGRLRAREFHPSAPLYIPAASYRADGRLRRAPGAADSVWPAAASARLPVELGVPADSPEIPGRFRAAARLQCRA